MKDIWLVIKVAVGILAVFALACLTAYALVGCSTETESMRYKLELATHDDPRFNWSQEALKRGDYGCPSAIYIAPDGVLTQCAP